MFGKIILGLIIFVAWVTLSFYIIYQLGKEVGQAEGDVYKKIIFWDRVFMFLMWMIIPEGLFLGWWLHDLLCP